MHSDLVHLQDRPLRRLSRAFKAGRLAGTYMLWGPEGVGHWATALTTTALLNCARPEPNEALDGLPMPCGGCRNCHNIFALNFEELLFGLPLGPHRNEDQAIDLANEILDMKRAEPFRMLSPSGSAMIPIDTVRRIKSRLARRHTSGLERVVIFYHMERMLPASADALLKLIEEPPDRTTIILTTVRPDSLPPTIQSRSQKIRLERSPRSAIEHALARAYKASAARIELAAALAEGSVGHAIEMIESGDGADDSVRATSLLIFRSMLTEPVASTMSHINQLVSRDDRFAAESILSSWQSLTRDCAALAVIEDSSLIINTDLLAELQALAPAFRNRALASLLASQIKNTLADLRRNVHIPTALMALALRVSTAGSAAV
ncbi:MAG: ATP-binding protein [Candidatus Zixiibacteriota bacterium]